MLAFVDWGVFWLGHAWDTVCSFATSLLEASGDFGKGAEEVH